MVECTTMSAPRLSGRWKNGLMKVLSTTRRAPFLWAMAARALMSQIFIIGLVGVSSHSRWKSPAVFSKAAASEGRGSRTSRRSGAMSFVNSGGCRRTRCRSPPRAGPASRSDITALVVARPDAKQMPSAPPSRAARFASRAKRVGFWVRAVLEALVLVDPLLHVGGGEVERRDHGTRGGIRMLSGVDAVGGETHGAYFTTGGGVRANGPCANSPGRRSREKATERRNSQGSAGARLLGRELPPRDGGSRHDRS